MFADDAAERMLSLRADFTLFNPFGVLSVSPSVTRTSETNTSLIDWKIVEVVGICKDGTKACMANHQLSVLTCILCKCLEKLGREHAYEHLKNSPLI